MAQADDLVIADLADMLVRAEAEVVIYRELVQVALGQLREAEIRQFNSSAQLAALREELRRYTSARVEPIEVECR